MLVDEDRQDCTALKETLEAAAAQANLTTKSAAAADQGFVVLNRIVVEELEAWFFGDCEALRAAYPRVSTSLEKKAGFRHPDSIAGGTWEQLERVLQQAGYHRAGLAKIVAGQDIAQHMDPDRNISPSFRQFCNGLRALAKQ